MRGWVRVTGAQYFYTVQTMDLDGDAITYTLVQAPYGMTINGATGRITWNSASTGLHSVTVQASDGVSVSTESYEIEGLFAHGVDGLVQVPLGESRIESFGMVSQDNGSHDLHIYSVEILDGDVGDFEIVDDQCSGVTLPNAGDQCRVYYRIAPSRLGTRTIRFRLTSNGVPDPFYVGVATEGVSGAAGSAPGEDSSADLDSSCNPQAVLCMRP